MRVKDVMTETVVSVLPQATISEALDAMVRGRLSGLPIIDENGALVGIVSEGDFLRRAELGTGKAEASWLACLARPAHAAEAYARTHGRRVDEIMNPDVATIDESASLEEAATLMEKRRVKRLPVLAAGKVVGMITRADFVRVLASFVRLSYDEPLVDDAEIKRRIEADMRAQRWAPIASVDVTVANGVVNLQGFLTDERERKALRAVAENVDGVRAVHDHMTCGEPYLGSQ